MLYLKTEVATKNCYNLRVYFRVNIVENKGESHGGLLRRLPPPL